MEKDPVSCNMQTKYKIVLIISAFNTINGAESSIRVVSQQNVPETMQTKIVGRSGEAAVSSDRKSIKFSINFHIQTLSAAIPVGGTVYKEYVSFYGYA